MTPPEETTIERIRTAAAELFAERGYGGASMAGIAERVGIQKASLYNYYPSKAELLLDLVQRAVERWKGACCVVEEQEGPAGEKLLAHLEATRRFAVGERDTLALIHLAAAQVGGELGERTQALYEEQAELYKSHLNRFFAAAMEAGEIRPGDPEVVTLAWASFVNGMLKRLIHSPSGDDPYAGRLEAVWRVFWQGLAPVPEGEIRG